MWLMERKPKIDIDLMEIVLIIGILFLLGLLFLP